MDKIRPQTKFDYNLLTHFRYITPRQTTKDIISITTLLDSGDCKTNILHRFFDPSNNFVYIIITTYT